MKNGGVTPRLLLAASFVRQGAVLADIGTDHAYLPLFLLKEGIIERAVCSDINRGPLASAEKNAREAGLTHKCEFVLSDGASALSGKGITDYAICGMGGELIRDIISRAPELYSEGVRLVLQPMSRQSVLRKFLYSEGFEISREGYAKDSGRYYLCVEAHYTGKRQMIDDVQAEIGVKDAINVNISEKIGYLEAKRASLLRAVRGKEMGGEVCAPEREILAAVEENLRALKKERVCDS